jgi:hypothetical protein
MGQPPLPSLRPLRSHQRWASFVQQYCRAPAPAQSAACPSVTPLLRRIALQGGLALGLMIFGEVSAPAVASAGLIFEFSDSINGAPPSSSPNPGGPPWLIATITDLANGNGVQMKLESRLAGDEFISNIGFNLDDAKFNTRSSGLTVNCSPSSGPCLTNFSSLYSQNEFSVTSGQNNPGGVSGFDLGLLFGVNQFQGESTATINITGAGLTANEFNRLNSEGLLMAAKVQGIGSGGNGSGEIGGTEVPGPLPLLGAVAAFRTSRRLRRRLASARLASGRPPAHRPA